MTKHTSYFSHDSNSRNDEKILAVRMRHGAEGYGVYFMILERLREEDDYTITKDYNTLAFDFRVSSALIKSIVEDFNLFTTTPDGKRFYSKNFMERMQLKDQASRKRSDAGRKGMEARWGVTMLPFEDNNVITNVENSITSKENKSKAKQNKEKESQKTPIHPPAGMINVSQIEQYLGEEQSWQEIICMQNNLTPEELRHHISQFANLLGERGETRKTPKDAKSHFANWLKIKLKEKNETHAKNNTNNSADQLQRDLANFASTHVGH